MERLDALAHIGRSWERLVSTSRACVGQGLTVGGRGRFRGFIRYPESFDRDEYKFDGTGLSSLILSQTWSIATSWVSQATRTPGRRRNRKADLWNGSWGS